MFAYYGNEIQMIHTKNHTYAHFFKIKVSIQFYVEFKHREIIIEYVDF